MQEPTLEQMAVWLVIGIIAGAAAAGLVRRALTLPEILLTGLIGAFLGGFILNTFHFNPPDITLTFNLADLITAFIGALVLIVFAEIIMSFRRRDDY